MRVKKYITVFWALVLFWLFTGAGTIMAQDKMYMRMADSEMKRFPEAWQIDWAKRPVFGYCQGVVTLAMLKVWKQTKDEKYYKYVEEYADKMVKEDGTILNYDYINGSLFPIHQICSSRKKSNNIYRNTLINSIIKKQEFFAFFKRKTPLFFQENSYELS